MGTKGVCWFILWQILCNEPVIKRGERRQAEVPCRRRQSMHAVACEKLARLTECLTSSRVCGWNVKPGEECSHVSSAERKKRKCNRMASSQLDRLVGQPG